MASKESSAMKYPYLHISPDFVSVLEHFTQYHDFLNFDQGTTVAISGTTRTVKMQHQGHEFYLKTYRYPKWIWKYSLVPSRVSYEWKSLQYLQKIGINTPNPVAYGEDRGTLWRLKSCFIVTEGVPHSKNLDEFIPVFFQRERDTVWLEQKKNMLHLLANHIAIIHQNYFIAHDLFWRNILIQEIPTLRFSFIDSPKGEQALHYLEPFRKLRMNWGRVKDLASLDKTGPDYFSRTDRLRFFYEYWHIQFGKMPSATEKRQWLRNIHLAAEKMRKRTQKKQFQRKQLDRQMEVAPEMRSCLQENQLDTYNAMLVVEGEKVSSHGTRKVIRKSLKNGPTIFVKISKYPHLKNIIPLRLKGITSVSLHEKKQFERLSTFGFAVPEFVAVGERHKYGLENSSFLALKELPQAVSLEAIIEEKTPKELLLRVQEIAILLRKLHHSGLYHRDLYTKHLLFSENQWYLIDLQRLCENKPNHLSWSAEDLAGLVCTCQQKKMSSKTYGLFLRYYLTGENRPLTISEKKIARLLILRIKKRLQHLRKRKKFRKYWES